MFLENVLFSLFLKTTLCIPFELRLKFFFLDTTYVLFLETVFLCFLSQFFCFVNFLLETKLFLSFEN